MRRVFGLIGLLCVRLLYLAFLVCLGAGVLLLHKDTGLREHAREIYVGLAIVGTIGLSLTGWAAGGD